MQARGTHLQQVFSHDEAPISMRLSGLQSLMAVKFGLQLALDIMPESLLSLRPELG